MKKLLKICLIFLTMTIVGCAGSSKYMVKSEPPQGPAPGKAIIYVMRPSGMGFAINFQIWDKDRFVGLSQAKSYFSYNVDPGQHLLIGIAENKVAVKCDVEAGKSYFIVTEPRVGGWKARMAFVPVNRESEYWGKVESYKSELNYLQPKLDEITAWEDTKRDEARNLVIFFENDPDREKYMSYIEKDDGI